MRSVLVVTAIFMMGVGGCSAVGSNKSKQVDTKITASEPAPVYRPGKTVLAYNRPGLVGRVATTEGHVLTTKPNQDYKKIQDGLDDEAKKIENAAIEKAARAKWLAYQKNKIARAKKQQIKLIETTDAGKNKPEQNPKKDIKKTKKLTKEDLWSRAWKHYCDNGHGMTDADIKIIKQANYIIPTDFADNCHPPK